MKLLNNFFYITSQERLPEENVVYNIRINPNHTIYKSHFPEQPITPGVCLLQMVSETLEYHIGRTFNLLSVKNIKFLNVLTPLEHIADISIQFCKIQEIDGIYHVQALINVPDSIIAKFSLIYEPLRSHPHI